MINGYLNQGMQDSVGDGTSDQWEKANVVSEQDAQPGDLVFQKGPEAGSDNHVGIICGKTDAGDWIAVHCSSSKNGVTVGEAYGASFRYIRQPSFYPTQEEVTQMESEGASASNAETVSATEQHRMKHLHLRQERQMRLSMTVVTKWKSRLWMMTKMRHLLQTAARQRHLR